MSTLSVLNLNDSGPGSLREAISDANTMAGADVIHFAPEVIGTISLSSGELGITDEVAIEGPGAHRLTVSGSGTSRVLQIFNGNPGSEMRVSISGLTIADGLAQSGGGLLNSGGDVTLTAVTVANNQSVPDADGNSFGGAIYNVGPGSILTLTNSTLAGNVTTGFVATGGGIANLFGATANVSDSTLIGNQAIGLVIATGGAIDNEVGGNVGIENTMFTDNLAAGGTFASSGGAISNTSGSTTNVVHSTFTGNNAIGGDGLHGQDGATGTGGAIINTSFTALIPDPAPAATLNITGSSFTANRALGGDGGPGGDGGGAEGGAIFNFLAGTVSIEDSGFTDNQAIAGEGNGGDGFRADGAVPGGASGGSIANVGDPANPLDTGGAVVTIIGSRFVTNQAIGNGADSSDGINGGGFGGAVLNQTGTLVIADSRFTGNQAIGGDAGEGLPGALADGGAIDTFLGDLQVTRSVFERNEARGGRGSNGEHGGHASGGAIMNSNSATELTDSLFAANRAEGGDAGASGDGGLSRGGALFNNRAVPGASSLTVGRVVFVGNTAAGGAAGSGGNGGDGMGGAVYLEGGTEATFERSAFLRNQAVGGHGQLGGYGLGGALHMDDDATFELLGIEHADLDTQLVLLDSVFTGNRASGSDGREGIGGGVYIEGGTARREHTPIRGNRASHSHDNVFGSFEENPNELLTTLD